jgi:hypothetical protein
MTDDLANLVLEHLRAIRGTLGEHGERLNNAPHASPRCAPGGLLLP